MIVLTVIRASGKNARYTAHSTLGRNLVTAIAIGVLKSKQGAS